jgi:tRNA (cmo5U34)-methyltransferase
MYRVPWRGKFAIQRPLRHAGDRCYRVLPIPAAAFSGGGDAMTDSDRKDRLYAKPRSHIGGFDFGEHTAEVFDDMLARSVPFYDEVQRMVCELIHGIATDRTRVYDLGCSTGTTLARLAEDPSLSGVTLVGVDNSEAMLARARDKLAAAGCAGRCELVNSDIGAVDVVDASAVIMLLTLQFVRPMLRDAVIRRIYDGLAPGGCLVLVEKVLCGDPRLNSQFIELYYDFKKRQGYSQLEIAQKREALENVLVPYDCDENMDLLRRNGFEAVDVFFRWYNFAGFVAVKHRP